MPRRTCSLAITHLAFTDIMRVCRPNIQLSRQVDVGIHICCSSPKRFSTMAGVRSADAGAEVAVEWEWK